MCNGNIKSRSRTAQLEDSICPGFTASAGIGKLWVSPCRLAAFQPAKGCQEQDTGGITCMCAPTHTHLTRNTAGQQGEQLLAGKWGEQHSSVLQRPERK
ncbi:hypothetical protein Y1Q_0011936 [Alligator mississippiensis]|uniref:Uncharacterized protein n=1 Tax=Alligator mississippiensis TaxID=8496 RepID=A0A151NCH3_ALLMI|nr:hypothetical protein Y1Q_0011936 [Alligator mississippiensis]